MGSCVTKDFESRTGLNASSLKKGSLVEFEEDSNIINFFPAKKKGQNYLKWVSDFHPKLSNRDIKQTVQQYTNHITWYCSTVNLLLAADSTDIEKHANYIRKLKYSILELSRKFPVKEKFCYRGLNCTKKEINHYKLGTTIYIPSFLSTSRNSKKFYISSKQNTLMMIRLNRPPNSAFSVNSEYSDFAKEEEEALFSCYSKFRVFKIDCDKEFNGKVFQYYMELELLEENELNNQIASMIIFGFI